MKTTMLVMAAFVTALATASLAPTASAGDGDGTEGTNPCNGLVDVTCDDNGNACVLWVDHDAPNIPKCLIGG